MPDNYPSILDHKASRAPHVLLVEDNPGDILLMKESFRNSHFAYVLSIARDGQEAIDFLNGIAGNTDASRPDLILMDLNLPKVAGLDVLAHVKGTQELRSIPVLVMSTSIDPTDIQKAYALGANCYLCKAGGLDEFFQMMRTLQAFWFRTAQFPERMAATA
jgi:chemotaxis family two-component system response regulator Rcp1